MLRPNLFLLEAALGLHEIDELSERDAAPLLPVRRAPADAAGLHADRAYHEAILVLDNVIHKLRRAELVGRHLWKVQKPPDGNNGLYC